MIKFDFAEVLYDFMAQEREKNTWIVDASKEHDFDEIASIVLGANDRMQTMPIHSMISVLIPKALDEPLKNLEKVNTNIHYL